MVTLPVVIALIGAYLIGSIPSAVWIGKFFYGVDVREHGSGNAGATNTFRVLGKRAGIPVLLIDIFKGWAAVMVGAALVTESTPKEQVVEIQMVMGISALFGHIFPILAHFRGGKGIATLVGITFALHPPATLVAIGVFLAAFLITHYISLGSILGALSFPFSILFLFPPSFPSFHVFGLFIAILVLFTHQKNIERLLRNEESKMWIKGKKNPKTTPREATE